MADAPKLVPDRLLIEHFDQRAARYTQASPWVTDPASLQPIVDLVTQSLPHRVVEIGVGTGAVPTHLERLSLLPDDYLGVDISPGMLDHATGSGWRAVLADAADLPLDRASVDLVVARQVLHYVKSVEDVLVEARRVLTTSGRICISQITSFDDRRDTAWWAEAVALRQRLRRRSLDEPSLREVLDDCGFVVGSVVETASRTSLANWLARYPLASEDELALRQHFRHAPASVRNQRSFKEGSGGEVTFAIRWVTIIATV